MKYKKHTSWQLQRNRTRPVSASLSALACFLTDMENMGKRTMCILSRYSCSVQCKWGWERQRACVQCVKEFLNFNFLWMPLLSPTQLHLWDFFLPKILLFTQAVESQGLSEIVYQRNSKEGLRQSGCRKKQQLKNMLLLLTNWACYFYTL